MTLSRNKSGTSHHSNNSNNSNSQTVKADLNSSINTNFQECADCSSPNANWASLNHGVLICDECCLAHRSLGRCISIIKSLRKSYWPQSLIDTLYELVRSNSNQIWESNLSSEGQNIKQLTLKNSKKSPSKDIKLNYIRTKYENLSYISRGKYSSIEELNQQLVASVKTSNYEATLRILSQGADANYKSQETGQFCLHTAALHNQLGQIELLCLYGGDVTCLDRSGQTPYDLAKANNLTSTADRLQELQFELTDDITYFLCNKRPDHKSGQHFLIPDIKEQFLGDHQNLTHFKLQELPDHLFEELSKDIYDELDRRQIETISPEDSKLLVAEKISELRFAEFLKHGKDRKKNSANLSSEIFSATIWKCTVSASLVNEPIPFLVIKSCFTQTRNQLRQKLARFNSAEFSMLLIEILTESKRRYYQFDTLKPHETSKNIKELDNLIEDLEDPLYDKVPSDEDYASVASESSCNMAVESKKKSKLIRPDQSFNPLSIKTSKSPTKNTTPSPSSSKTKVLTTNFDKPAYLNTIANKANNPALIANAESALNLIMNSLNQIDYSHLGSPLKQTNNTSHSPDIYSKERLNHVSPEMNSAIVSDLKNLKEENNLMQAMIERLMEENAQLRAEKMITAVNPGVVSSNISENIKNVFLASNQTSPETDIYSTVRNKKFNQLRDSFNTNVHNLKLNSYKLEQNRSDETKPVKQPFSKKVYLTVENKSNDGSTDNVYSQQQKQKAQNGNNGAENLMFESLKIIEETYDNPCETVINGKDQIHSPSKASFIHAKQQKLLQQERANYSIKLGSKQNNTIDFEQAKLSPSKSMILNASTSPTKNNFKQNISHPELDKIPNYSETMPTKDLVIRKMKKITKAVQELFKATKESEFGQLRSMCEKVNMSVNEMIALFPKNLNSKSIQDNLANLIENSHNLMNLVLKYNLEIDSFSSLDYEEEFSATKYNPGNSDATVKTVLSNSSSSSSAISSGSEMPSLMQHHLKNNNQESPILKNMIVSNLVTYSYEIAYTVKRIVCIMGAENS